MATLPPGGAQISHQGTLCSFVEEKIKNFRKVENEPKTQLFVGRTGRHLLAR